MAWVISRKNPACFIFLLDQSGSMKKPLAGSSVSKAQALANSVNATLEQLLRNCQKDDTIRHYCDVAIIGYSTDDDDPEIIHVDSAFANEALQSKDIVGVEELFEHSLFDANNQPYWYLPVARGGTPMTNALAHCREIAEKWCAEHPESIAPIIIHVTDGASTDEGDPVAEATDICFNVDTDVNYVQIFTCHLSENDIACEPFPVDEIEVADEFAKQLFKMSTEMPEHIRQQAAKDKELSKVAIRPGAKFLIFNSNELYLKALFSLGTQVSRGKPQGKQHPYPMRPDLD